MDKSPIIIGAGIAGLSSALALAHKGIASTVIEKRKQLDAVGAGIQLTPNVTRILARWGILGKLTAAGVTPHFLELRSGISLETHLRADLIRLSKQSWNAPYITIHRANLQKVLHNAVIENPLIRYKAGETVISCSQTATKNIDVKTIKTDAKIETKQQFYSTPLLIVCDGVWSTLRQLAPFHEKADFSGLIAWRATIGLENLPEKLRSLSRDMKTITAWMGPKNHLVVYPIQLSEKILNFVAITRGKNEKETWSYEGKKEKLSSLFKGWNPKISQTFDHIGGWRCWPLFKMRCSRFLGLERQVFVGDCAHAILPFAAQGAAMAIEDAATLAEALSLKNHSLTESLSVYERMRSPRVAAVRRRGDFNRMVYHATGPVAIIRDFIMKIRGPESMMSDLNWLYTHDVMNLTKK
ncbi:FAD-binding protein [Bartonella sp. CB178]|uniref:FAD-binding protein n=1 Tax=Bartonella sp. CB178 TaxID=3112255 RepID=UPI00300DD04B